MPFVAVEQLKQLIQANHVLNPIKTEGEKNTDKAHIIDHTEQVVSDKYTMM